MILYVIMGQFSFRNLKFIEARRLVLVYYVTPMHRSLSFLNVSNNYEEGIENRIWTKKTSTGAV